ncbi:MAG: HD domain-containing protein [Candidatus Aenigmarchaeota archaeon]|nr:HD domain-containing protein [Candidatus Aenigmarchaeota archaeon]
MGIRTKIADEVGANAETVILSALFHDIARVWGVQRDPDLMDKSLETTEEIMARHGYSTAEIQAVKDAIIPHSCRDGMKPYTEEGRVLATADALAHLMTDFYFALWENHWLAGNMTFDDYVAWALKKIERDFHRKIFYDKWRKIAERKYNDLKSHFAQF